MRCTCGQTNMICPVHPPMGAPTNTCVMAADFNDPMELISTKELDELRERLRQREAELEEAQAEIEIRDELVNVIKGESPVAPLIERLKQRWVYVKDRLPEEHGQYLVWVHGVGSDGDMVSVTTEARFDKFNWFMEGGWLSHEVQGWQPLPPPPKVQP